MPQHPTAPAAPPQPPTLSHRLKPWIDLAHRVLTALAAALAIWKAFD